MPTMISVFLTEYSKIQHGKSKAKTTQLFFFIYGRFHYQPKETIMITLLSKSIPWNNFVGVKHKCSTILGVGKQNALDGGQGQIILQEKPKRLEEKHWYRGKNTTLKTKFLGSKSDFFID